MKALLFLLCASLFISARADSHLCGDADACLRRGTSRPVWMSPSESSPVVGGDIVIKGEFDDSDLEFDRCDVIEVPGTGRYIPNWPEMLPAVLPLFLATPTQTP